MFFVEIRVYAPERGEFPFECKCAVEKRVEFKCGQSILQRNLYSKIFGDLVVFFLSNLG